MRPKDASDLHSIVEAAIEVENLLLRIASELKFLFDYAPQLDERLAILIAVIGRSVSASKAIRLLRAEDEFFEDANVLVRSLIETVINGVYLQNAPDEEVLAYRHFDVIPVAKLLNYIDSSAPQQFAASISGFTQRAFATHVQSVKARTGKTANDFGWTKLKLKDRAIKIDRSLGNPGFSMLANGIFPVGHAYVHGNYSSIQRALPFAPRPGLQPVVHEPLYLSTLALAALGAAVNQMKKCIEKISLLL